jgi:hypothetical protein
MPRRCEICSDTLGVQVRQALRLSPQNHVQTARNLDAPLRSAADGARLNPGRGLTANQPPISPPPLQMPWRSLTGSSAALIDASDATRRQERRSS